eukprot:TRINITY_DN40432_c0_g2_i1.p1 TRINITY_DN40432_c0_g2~~TRINITY_DN40432_c0_g2_i1.p1  ORF type:complete len:293 (+),score=49.27 TRINITY_DN40432_c0_g2_i1:225-1103(+)
MATPEGACEPCQPSEDAARTAPEPNVPGSPMVWQGESVMPPQLRMGADALPEDMTLFGWKPQEHLTADENGMDLVILLARNSRCGGGHMGAAIVNADGVVLACHVNGPLYASLTAKKCQSDIHAEVNAIGACAQRGIATRGCTAYITMPPCKKCFTVLAGAGIRRVVSRREYTPQDGRDIKPAAKRTGMTLITLPDTDERVAYRESLIPAKRPREEKEESEKPLCKKFMRLGGCDLGDACKFIHDEAAFKQPCKHYLSGKCKQGADCKFVHESEATPAAEKKVEAQAQATTV